MIFALLVQLHPIEVHHDDCLGASAEVDSMARRLNIAVRIHPGMDPLVRAYLSHSAVENYPPVPPVERDHAIVDYAQTFIAALHETQPHHPFHGIWETITYARTRNRHRVLVLPSGETRVERAER